MNFRYGFIESLLFLMQLCVGLPPCLSYQIQKISATAASNKFPVFFLFKYTKSIYLRRLEEFPVVLEREMCYDNKVRSKGRMAPMRFEGMFGKMEQESWLIVGLGNPGEKYDRTRHNCGFRAIDLLAAKLNCRLDKGKFQGLYGRCDYRGVKLYLLKPMTYMNLSGQSVLALSSYFSIPPQRIIVMFDDISLVPGRLRVRPDGSAGGHNGIKSIIASLGSQAFPRVKIGVGAKPEQFDLADWVLSAFSAAEEKDLAPALERAGEAALCIIDRGVAESANRYNGSK